MATVNLGKCLFHPEGNHDKSKSYIRLSVVMDENGDTYIARKDVPIGIEISNTKYWQITASINAKVNQVQADMIELEKRIDYGAGEINVQSDWNVTDSTNDAYIKNKPTIPSAYTLPTASTSTLGGIKVDGSSIKINSGVISSTGEQNVQSDWSITDSTNDAYIKNKPTIPSAYTLPTASTSVLGGVKVDGNTIKINSGVISTIGEQNVQSDWSITDTASDSFIKNKPTLFSGSYNDLTSKPTIPSAYTLPKATTTTLGGVKVDGTTITVADGVISSIGGADSSITNVNVKSNSEGQITELMLTLSDSTVSTVNISYNENGNINQIGNVIYTWE